MDLSLIKLISALLLPPGNSIVLMLTGSFVIMRHYRTGRFLILGGFTLLLLSSLPITPILLARWVEDVPVLDARELQHPSAQAIVILGGGIHGLAPEFGQAAVSHYTLVRLRYGAWLHRQTRLPVLLSGGNVYAQDVEAEANVMQRSLHRDFNVPVKWLDNQSRNTWENAENSARLLNRAGKKRIYLVTHASHMKRARDAFERAGLTVIPAPTAFTTDNTAYPFYSWFIPSATSIQLTRQLSHEQLGQWWYRIRY